MNTACEIASPGSVADFLLIECRERGDVLTNLKLQKLLYYAQAWFLAAYNKSLFSEDFQAWVHGPVLLSQYQRFKQNEWRPIQDELVKPDLPLEVKSHLLEIVDIFGIETGVSLERMTHNEQPWIIARGGIPADEASTAIISKESMKFFYQSL
jgi:uncharacterized phage-associated protein